ncbi:hypothetical protein PoB_005830500 [Plakobranchus ocellatus]|uniref:Uncharacterized protein n=1 Tax=Plakobranchus ocellatus TaxID=259542 RepID=A0AAV4CJN6_9GAST|nr:hypothetical protein PoB_005830500 [Plakobranchus ocellatus]
MSTGERHAIDATINTGGGTHGWREKQLINSSRETFEKPRSILCINRIQVGWFVYIASPQQGDLRLLGPPSGQGAGGGARTRDRRVPADLREDSPATQIKIDAGSSYRYVPISNRLKLDLATDKYAMLPRTYFTAQNLIRPFYVLRREMGVEKRGRTPRSELSLAQYKMAAASTREAFVANRHTLWLRGALTSRETFPVNNASKP